VVVLIGLAAAFFVLAAMRAAQGLIAPAMLALVIAIAVSPLQSWLARKLPGWLAMIVTIIATFAILFAFVWMIGWALYQFGTEIPQYVTEFQALRTTLTTRLEDLGVDATQIREVLNLVDLGQVADVALDVAQGLYGVVSTLSFIVFLLFFLLVDGGSFNRRFAAVKRFRPEVAAGLSEFGVGVRRYLIVTTVFGLLVATVDVIFLIIVGVPLPLVWGVLAFLTGYIPTVGLIIGLIPPVVIALLDSGWETAVVVLIGYLLINNGIQNIVQPRFIGEAVGLNVAASFASLVLWGFVLGPLGALIAIPMSLLARALLTDRDPRHQWIGILLGDRSPPEEDVHALAVATGSESHVPTEPEISAPRATASSSASSAGSPHPPPPDLPEPRTDPAT
jgi:predicted PurR-regulated permease PerM